VNKDNYYMKLALKEAMKAYKKDDVPIGCVIVKDDKVIARAYNKKELKQVATLHAEVCAIYKACRKLGSWRLDDCVLYTTVEPCLMCTGAIVQSRIKRVVYGTANESFGYFSKLDNSKIEVSAGILEENCQSLLSNFFKEKRK